MNKRLIAERVMVLLALGVFVVSMSAIAGCQTVKGVGKDIQNVGEAGEDAIDGED